MSGTGGFQTQVGTVPAPGIEGNFASQNPYGTVDAGPGGLVAGAAGVLIGRFAWTAPPVDPNGTNKIANNFGAGLVAGLVAPAALQGLITDYLAIAGLRIQRGFMVTLLNWGDVWVRNAGSAAAQPGMKAYADLTDGSISFAATGAPATGASVTASIAASTSSVTGSISGDILTVTAVGSGVVRPGTTISGTGVASGTKVGDQLTPLLSGEALGGIGRYYVSIPEQVVSSTTISGTYGTMTVTAVGSGEIEVGDVLSGASVTTGTTVTQFISGTGGTGTYAVDQNTVVSSTTVTAVNNVETKWYATSAGATGEVVKISSIPPG